MKSYKSLTSEDINSEDFRFAPIIVTGNYERHELNAFQARLWALYHNTHVIRWKRQLNFQSWEGQPGTLLQTEEAQKEVCFWEYFVPKAPAYLTYNLNVSQNLANGTEVVEDSLSFTSKEDEQYLIQMKEHTPIGSTIDLPNPPSAINVELYPYMEWETDSEKEEKRGKRRAWTSGSLVNDGRIIIPISIAHKNKTKWNKDSIRARGGRIRFRASRMLMADYFPIELGFSFTVPKAQGRTIRREIASLSEHPDSLLRCTWEQLYVILSRIRHHEHSRLLLKMNDRSTLRYIAELKKDPYTAYYFKGFPNQSSDEVSYWNEALAARQANFI